MAESIKTKTHTYTFDTTNLCKLFNVSGAQIIKETYEYIPGKYHFLGMLGKKHSKKTKKKMSLSAKKHKPHLHRGGKIIKDGKIYEFSCLSHAAKDLKLSTGHLSELLSGKRKTVKGWKNAA